MTGATIDCLLNIYNDTILLTSLILETQPQSPYSVWSCRAGYSGLSQVAVTAYDYNNLTQTSSGPSLEEVFALEQLPLVTVMEPTSTLVTPTLGKNTPTTNILLTHHVIVTALQYNTILIYWEIFCEL